MLRNRYEGADDSSQILLLMIKRMLTTMEGMLLEKVMATMMIGTQRIAHLVLYCACKILQVHSA